MFKLLLQYPDREHEKVIITDNSTTNDQLRTRLEKTLPETESARLRGQIAEIRSILSFAKDDGLTIAWGDGIQSDRRQTREEQLDKFRN